MKNIIFVAFLLSINIYAQSTSFDKGYQQGYKEGYCYQDFGCIQPIPPISPMPNINEDSNNYKDGYQRGFLDGKDTKSKNNETNSSQSFNQYTPADFGEYIEPYDFDLLNAAMANKQKKYDENVKLIQSKVNHINELFELFAKHKDTPEISKRAETLENLYAQYYKGMMQIKNSQLDYGNNSTTQSIVSWLNQFKSELGRLAEEVKQESSNRTDDKVNLTNLYNQGVMAYNKGDFETAKKHYQKALEIDSYYKNANLNMAVILFDEEKEVVKKINSLYNFPADNEEYDRLRAKRLDILKQAKPYLEKVIFVEPNNLEIVKTLRGIYIMLDDTVKFKEMSEKVKYLESKN